MPEYPCIDCGALVTLKQPPHRGKTRCKKHKQALRADQQRKRIAAKKSAPNLPGDGVRFSAAGGKGKRMKLEERIDRLCPLYLELVDESGKAVYHADRCDYLRLAAAFAELRAPLFVKRCERLYSERMETK